MILKQECEENHKSDRKKWLGEKMILIAQAKEAETHRNREMKRFAGDREHHAKQLLEAVSSNFTALAYKT